MAALTCRHALAAGNCYLRGAEPSLCSDSRSVLLPMINAIYFHRPAGGKHCQATSVYRHDP